MASEAYDFWLFDLDGTVVDVERSYQSEVLTEVGDRLGCTFHDAETEGIWHDTGTVRRDAFRREGVDVDRFWEVFDGVADPASRAEATYLYDDAAPIAAIDRPVGIVTHCPPAVTRRVLRTLDIADWFATVVCCTPELGMKPDARPVERAIAGLESPTGRGVLVGDSDHDIGAAWNAGLNGVHIERRDPAARGYCIHCDRRVTAVDELVG